MPPVARRATLGLVLAALTACPAKPAPEPPVRSCMSVLRFSAVGAPAITVQGEWGAFAPELMTARGDGVFEWLGLLEPRAAGYAYRFGLPDGGLVLDPLVPSTRWVAGTEHSRLLVPSCEGPRLEVLRFRATADGSVVLDVQAQRGAKGTSLQAPQVTLDRGSVESAFVPTTGVLAVAKTGLAAGKHTLSVTLADGEGRAAAPLWLPFWIEAEPFEWRDAVIYFAFTDRFRNGDPGNDAPVSGVPTPANFQGGDFAGITAAIEEGVFDRLGVRALWLSPFDANPETGFPGTDGRQYSGYHGYWPSRPREVQRRFGTLDELRALSAAAHRRGIRVLADLVLNHVHESHPYYLDHRDDGWFNVGAACVCGAPGCDWDSHALGCWFTAYLPDLDWKSTPLSDQVAGDVTFWLEQADLDGFRIDAAKHVLPAAIRTVREVTEPIAEATGTPIYLLGETFTGAGDQASLQVAIGPHLLDGQFDFPIYWPIIEAFAKGGSLKALDAAARVNDTAWAPGTLNSPFLGNHDLPRFASVAAGQIGSAPLDQAWSAPPPAVTSPSAFVAARHAFTFLFGQPGAPLVYYGDELALAGAGDPDNRRLMPWAGLSAAQLELRGFVEKLGQARRKSPALRRGDRDTLLAEDDVLVMQRTTAGEVAVVALSRSATVRTVSIALARGAATGTPRTFIDALSGQTVMLGAASDQLVLAPGAAQVLVGPR